MAVTRGGDDGAVSDGEYETFLEAGASLDQPTTPPPHRRLSADSHAIRGVETLHDGCHLSL